MKIRNKRQKECLDSIINKDFRGFIDVAPRFGKSKVVCDAIKKIAKKAMILITVPNNDIIESWKIEFKKWKVNSKNINLINQRSLHKEDYTKYDIIICDEIHSLSNKQIEYVSEFRKIFGLSGSISKDTELKLRKELNLECIYRYSIDQAVEDDIISDYAIYKIPVELNSTVKYIETGGSKKKWMTTEMKQYQYLSIAFEKFRRASWSNPKLNNVKMQAASKRADFIYKCKSKVNVAKAVMEKFSRCLVFTGRIEVAEELGYAHHSKSEEDNFNKFMKEKINTLAIVEMANMGITFPNLKVGIFHQMKSNEEAAIQKVMRMCNLEGKEKAKIFVIYYANTIDQQWCEKALQGFDVNKIHLITNLNEIDGIEQKSKTTSK